jgi:uncharacterized protein (TIGR02301 family)
MRFFCLFLVGLLMLNMVGLTAPSKAQTKASPKVTGTTGETAPAPAVAPSAPPVYFPDLLVLSEALGTLVALGAICTDVVPTSATLRAQAAELIEAEGQDGVLRGQLVGRFNRGFSSHAFAHPVCTAATRSLIERQMDRTKAITSQLATRFKG